MMKHKVKPGKSPLPPVKKSSKVKGRSIPRAEEEDEDEDEEEEEEGEESEDEGGDEDAAAELARLRREVKELKKSKASGKSAFSMKVSQKGALSIYHGGRFPVTLYRQQWEKILGKKKSILAFIEEHSDDLSVKGE